MTVKTVILAGGEGTRLRPLTINIPKAMVPVLNTPFLEHVIRHLRNHQLTDITLTLGHLSPTIQTYFGDGSLFDIKLKYTVEDTPRGTAGAVKMAGKYLDGTFVVLNGDIYTTLDISAMLAFHREKKATVTIALTPVADPTDYGLVETENSRVTRFVEKPTHDQITTNMINAGTYILEPDILQHIPPETNFSFERELFPMLLKMREPVYAYPSTAYWIDIGTPEKYFRLHADLLKGAETKVGEQSVIHPSVKIEGPVLIGADCDIRQGVRIIGPTVIGASSTIRENAVVETSLLWRNVRVGPQVKLKNSIIADNCSLFYKSTINESILGDNVVVPSGVELEPGSKIWPRTMVSSVLKR
jgi:mannose-1-phosphate guanylyltransferase